MSAAGHRGTRQVDREGLLEEGPLALAIQRGGDEGPWSAGEGCKSRQQYTLFPEHLLCASHWSVSEQKQTETLVQRIWRFSGRMTTVHTQGRKLSDVRGALARRKSRAVSADRTWSGQGSGKSDKASQALSLSSWSAYRGLRASEGPPFCCCK